MSRRFALPFLLLAASSIVLAAQETPPPGHLDPTRDIRNPVLFSSFHKPLPEQYIWTHDPAHQNREQRQTPRFSACISISTPFPRQPRSTSPVRA